LRLQFIPMNDMLHSLQRMQKAGQTPSLLFEGSSHCGERPRIEPRQQVVSLPSDVPHQWKHPSRPHAWPQAPAAHRQNVCAQQRRHRNRRPVCSTRQQCRRAVRSRRHKSCIAACRCMRKSLLRATALLHGEVQTHATKHCKMKQYVSAAASTLLQMQQSRPQRDSQGQWIIAVQQVQPTVDASCN